MRWGYPKPKGGNPLKPRQGIPPNPNKGGHHPLNPQAMERDLLAIYVLQSKPISRSAGRSMVAAAAYRSGENLTNEQDGRAHKYQNRASDIEFKRVLVPTDRTLSELKRSTLWNAAEAAEKRKNSRTGREFVLALPHELNQEQRAQLAQDFALELVKRYKVAADVCIHKPSKDGDERNYHAHILITTRSVSVSNDENLTPVFGDKAPLEWSDKQRQEKGLRKGADEIEDLRKTWETLANKSLERAGQKERIDCRTNEAQGIERIPEKHQGHRVTALERKGIRTHRGNKNRSIRQKNELLKRVEATHNSAIALLKREQQRAEEQAKPPPVEPSRLKVAVVWTLSLVSQRARELLEQLKAQKEEAKKRAEKQRAKSEEAKQLAAKEMKRLEAKKEGHRRKQRDAEFYKNTYKKQADQARARKASALQRIENEKKNKLERQKEQERREAYRRQYGHDPEPPKPPTPPRGRGRSR